MRKRIILFFMILGCAFHLHAQKNVVMSLSQCREMALQNNEDLKKADNSLRKAQLEKKIASLNFFPKIDGSAGAAYMVEEADVMGNSLIMKGTYMAGLSLAQPLYTGGKILSGRNIADVGLECAKESVRKTRMDVIYDADNAYWTYLSVLDKVKMLERYEVQMDTLKSQIQASVNANMATDNDLLRVEAKTSDIKYQLQKARNGAEICRMVLCNVTGLDFDTDIVLKDTMFVVDRPQMNSYGTSLRPELKLLENQVKIGREQVKIARADILPTLAVSLGYTYYGNLKMEGLVDAGNGNYIPFTQNFDDGFTVAMATLSVPLCSWGAGLKKIKKARLDVENAVLDLEKNRKLMDIEVASSENNFREGYMLVETARIGLEQAKENLRVMKNKYDASLLSLTDLLEAQSLWQQAESNYIEAKAQYKIYETEYLRATGVLGY